MSKLRYTHIRQRIDTTPHTVKPGGYHTDRQTDRQTDRAGNVDSSVVRALDSPDSFESLLEWRENFLLRGQLSVLTLISVSVAPPCYRSST